MVRPQSDVARRDIGPSNAHSMAVGLDVRVGRVGWVSYILWIAVCYQGLHIFWFDNISFSTLLIKIRSIYLPIFIGLFFLQSGIGNPTSYIFNPAEETEIQDTACINDALYADENYTDASEDEREFEEYEGETTFQSGANYLMRRQTSNYCESSSTNSN
jgi:hypothetical protein